ncbi:SDR family NAD(P)-dependent oxidoreductase [Anaeroselena agilis]|uniref:SDR family NAD(P)-dependent oxidoreductase n=1 Tax=Anaeroselena agilis TaxID=3063788 RepID=A0ABU3NSE1_9FIRM|nr:SDR family NAD(P)-dependent oxidoreductase [Selenomonadales bacterium 4137-cl]
MELRGKVAVVTGAAGGLGREIALGLAARGCKVAAVDKDEAAIAELAAEMPGLSTFVCDVTDQRAVALCLGEVYGQLGEVDCLINNAGLIFSGPLVNPVAAENRRHTVEAWDRVIKSNLYSVFLTTVEVADRMMMKRTKGVIVNISSVAAKGNGGQCAYSAAKAGVEAFTRAAAKEVGAWGIRVVAIAPGFMDTPSTRAAMSQNILEEWKRKTALRRFGGAENVVGAVVHALENEFLTGCVIPVDGGVSL